jgi:hypothetical protein
MILVKLTTFLIDDPLAFNALSMKIPSPSEASTAAFYSLEESSKKALNLVV